MTGLNLARKPLGPADCAFGLAIPTSERRFRSDLRRDDRGFARSFDGWPHYSSQVMSAARTVLPQMRRIGVEVVTDVELGDYGRLLRRDFKVIILMAHWSGRTVEFADGFAEVPAILAQFPPGIVRLFDLSICHPEPLAMAMRLRLSDDCLIRYGTSGATPALWLYFYLSLFHQLRSNKLSYLQAFELNMETWRASHHAGAI